MSTQDVLIADVYTKDELPVHIKFAIDGVTIGVGKSAPDRYQVLLEYRDGIPFLVVWDDLEDEEPSHQIALLGAV